MMPGFVRLAGATWTAHVDGVGIFVDDDGGRKAPHQLAIASRIAADLDAVPALGASYLDAFVDRQKAFGKPGENWWLDEMAPAARHGKNHS